MIKKIIIIGAGISGLTVAHELSKSNLDIHIYEKDLIVGGMAKTFRDKNNIPTEHSWRGYGPFYYNLFNLFKEIPLSEINNNNYYSIKDIKKLNDNNRLVTYYKDNVYDLTDFIAIHPGGKIIKECANNDLEYVWSNFGNSWHTQNKEVSEILEKYKIGKLFLEKSVYDNLNINRLQFEFLFNKGKQDVKLTTSDYIFLFTLFIKVICSNKRKNDYFKIRLDPIIKQKLSKEGYYYISDFLAGPGYGFDKNTMSLGHYALFIEYNLSSSNKLWQVMNKPTNEGWFDPWTTYLKSKNVKINLNQTLEKINYENNQIISVIINGKIIIGDEFILAINPFALDDIIANSKLPIQYNKSKLNINNNQISFRIGFKNKIKFPIENSGYVLIDSPYNITFYPQEDHFNKDIDLGTINNIKIKTLLSGTLILPYNNGSLYNKSALELNLDELKKEIQYQFSESKNFMMILKNSNMTLDDIIFQEIYDDWYYQNGLKTKNKKWVNNFINEEHRLKSNTVFNNLFIAGAHTKTSVNIWSMEGAVESGKIVASKILNKYSINNINIYIYNHKSNIIYRTIGNIDNIFYDLGLPHIFFELVLILIVILIISIKKLYYKKKALL